MNYQKQSITASLAAESGAAMALRWLQVHPDAWGNESAWKAENGLPFEVPSASNLGSSTVYWIKSVRFDRDTAVIISRGGMWVAGKVLGQGAVMVALKNENYQPPIVSNKASQDGDTLSSDDEIHIQKDIPKNTTSWSIESDHKDANRMNETSTKAQEIKVKVFTWRPLTVTE